MAEIDFGGWLARKYDIMQQNANTNAAEVEQRNSAAVMQYGVGGVYDRGETAATKRKQMELDQDTYKYDKGFPLLQMEAKGRFAANMGSANESNTVALYNRGMTPELTRLQQLNNDAMEYELRKQGISLDNNSGLGGSKTFNETNNSTGLTSGVALPNIFPQVSGQFYFDKPREVDLSARPRRIR